MSLLANVNLVFMQTQMLYFWKKKKQIKQIKKTTHTF